MFSYTYRHRVRYRECDPMNMVYHSHYVDYLEYARTEALRHLGIRYRSLEAAGVIMPVVDLAIRFKRPAYYDDLLEITASVAEPPRTRIRIEYEIRRRDEAALLASAKVTLCFVDRERNRPVAAPPELASAFSRAISDEVTVPSD